jgi:large subunit ribosomal protein L13
MTQTQTMKTFAPRPRDIERRWYVIDANGAVLGRLASEVAKILRGKHKPIFAPHADTGDHVIVVNAGGVRVTGGKESEKMYYRHSGFPGGIRAVSYTRLLAERPVLAVEKAVKGMLPKNRLGRQMATKLNVYEGPEHPHRAQKPVVLALGAIPKWEGLPTPKPRPEPKPKAKPKARGAGAKGAERATGPGARTRRGPASSGTTRARAGARAAGGRGDEAAASKSLGETRRRRAKATSEAEEPTSTRTPRRRKKASEVSESTSGKES